MNFRGAQARAMARQLLHLAQSETESTAQRHAHLVSALHVLTSLPAVAQYGGEQLARDVVLELTFTSAGSAEATNATLANLEEAAGTPGLTQGMAQPVRGGLRDLRAHVRAHQQEEPRRCKSCGENKPKSAHSQIINGAKRATSVAVSLAKRVVSLVRPRRANNRRYGRPRWTSSRQSVRQRSQRSCAVSRPSSRGVTSSNTTTRSAVCASKRRTSLMAVHAAAFPATRSTGFVPLA